jgi:hypothetical protein
MTALGTVWATLRQSQNQIQTSVSDSFKTMIKEMTEERNELCELIRQAHRENLELQKELRVLRATRAVRKPPGKAE